MNDLSFSSFVVFFSEEEVISDNFLTEEHDKQKNKDQSKTKI